MDLVSFSISMASMGGLGAIFAIGLIIANSKLQVDEDPRIARVLEALPGVNCGGCGYPGCNAFAERIVAGQANIAGCPVNTDEGVREIGGIMGIDADIAEKKFARVFCQGGNQETAKKGSYIGIKTCLAAHLTFGGEKLCQFGCIGYGDCVTSCQFDAITLNDNGLPVVNDDLCTGCGNCVTACPRDIIELHPQRHNLYILCRNKDEAKYARSVCLASCTACKACVKKVEEGQIRIDKNLAIVDYDTYGSVEQLPTEKCPNSVIVMIPPVSKI